MENKNPTFHINKADLPLVLTAEQIIQVLGFGRRNDSEF